jgi:hypothetical protein
MFLLNFGSPITCKSTRCNIPEGQHRHHQARYNLKSHTTVFRERIYNSLGIPARVTQLVFSWDGAHDDRTMEVCPVRHEGNTMHHPHSLLRCSDVCFFLLPFYFLPGVIFFRTFFVFLFVFIFLLSYFSFSSTLRRIYCFSLHKFYFTSSYCFLFLL